MKNWKAFLTLCLCAALILTMTACAGETALGEMQELGADSKVLEETYIPPEETMDKLGEALAVYESDPSESEPRPMEEITLPSMVGNTEFQSIRVQDISREKLEHLISKYHPGAGDDRALSMVHITHGDSLEKLLQEVNSQIFREKCIVYDETFFEGYDLVVIPRVTNSGSVQHSAELVKEEGKLLVSISVSMPEYATADMANWLLVVPVPKTHTQGVTVTAGMESAPESPTPSSGRLN